MIELITPGMKIIYTSGRRGETIHTRLEHTA